MQVPIKREDLPAEIDSLLEGQEIIPGDCHREVFILDTLIGYNVFHRGSDGVEYVSSIVNGDGGLYEDDRQESICLRCGKPSAGHDCPHEGEVE